LWWFFSSEKVLMIKAGVAGVRPNNASDYWTNGYIGPLTLTI